MALVPCVTNANPSLSLLGGGGGGGGSGPVTSTTQFFVSSITGENSQNVVFTNGALFAVAADLQMAGGATAPQGDIWFVNNNGQLAGVSTINGAPYSAAPNISTVTTSGGYFGDAVVNLNPVLASISQNKWYMASLEITDMTFVSQPNATDAFNIVFGDGANTTNLGTFNMAQVSTNRGVLGDNGFSVSGPHESLSTIGAFQYKANVGAPSTFIVTGGIGWLQPL